LLGISVDFVQQDAAPPSQHAIDVQAEADRLVPTNSNALANAARAIWERFSFLRIASGMGPSRNGLSEPNE